MSAYQPDDTREWPAKSVPIKLNEAAESVSFHLELDDEIVRKWNALISALYAANDLFSRLSAALGHKLTDCEHDKLNPS